MLVKILIISYAEYVVIGVPPGAGGVPVLMGEEGHQGDI